MIGIGLTGITVLTAQASSARGGRDSFYFRRRGVWLPHLMWLNRYFRWYVALFVWKDEPCGDSLVSGGECAVAEVTIRAS